MFKKRTKRLSQKNYRGRKTSQGKVVKSRKNTNYFSSSVYSSIIILAGLLSLSFTIFLFSRQLRPIIKNERLKFLCTYQLGDKKSQKYKEANLKLKKLVGDSNKYCKNFLLPKEKNNRRFRIFPILKSILFRFI